MLNFENVKTIAYLAPQGSFTEMAKDYFCQKFDLHNVFQSSFDTIKEVVEYVSQTPDCIGVLPLENSIFGTVRETLDNLIVNKNPNIKIISEHFMPMKYCLLSRTTELYSISGIISSPEILAKCKEFVKNDMPYNVNIVEASSAPEAARNLQGYNLTYASIGSPKLAEIFNLNILKENISDDKTNQTRFVLIGDIETEETGSDNTTIVFSPENKPGGLLNILNIFMKNNINLSFIASQTSNKMFGDYIVTLTFDGHIKNAHILNTLREVKDKAAYMKFLGSYKKGKPII